MQPPVILTGPQSQTVPEGTDVSFTVMASGSGTLIYQWQHNSSNIAGATTSALSLPNVQPWPMPAPTRSSVSNPGGSVGSSDQLERDH